MRLCAKLNKHNLESYKHLQESALNFVINDDLEKLTSLLAEVSETSDENQPEALPEDHWINRPFEKETGLKTLLHLAVEKSPEHRAENFARILISAGARPDLYNEHLGVAPIHVAARLVGVGISGGGQATFN